jgi:hypothetical protein
MAAAAGVAGVVTFGVGLTQAAVPTFVAAHHGGPVISRLLAGQEPFGELPPHPPELPDSPRLPAVSSSGTASTMGVDVPGHRYALIDTLVSYGYAQTPVTWPGAEAPRSTLILAPTATRSPAPLRLLPDMPAGYRWEARTMRPVWVRGAGGLALTAQFSGWPWDPGSLLDGG